jgi:hypothetical protein
VILNVADRLSIDRVLRAVQRAQQVLELLMDEGLEKALTDTSEGAWRGYFERHSAACSVADIAHGELQALYRSMIVRDQG